MARRRKYSEQRQPNTYKVSEYEDIRRQNDPNRNLIGDYDRRKQAGEFNRQLPSLDDVYRRMDEAKAARERKNQMAISAINDTLSANKGGTRQTVQIPGLKQEQTEQKQPALNNSRIDRAAFEAGKGPRQSFSAVMEQVQKKQDRIASRTTKQGVTSFGSWVESLGDKYNKGGNNVTPENVTSFASAKEKQIQQGLYGKSNDTWLHSNAQQKQDYQRAQNEVEQLKQEQRMIRQWAAENKPTTAEEEQALRNQAEVLNAKPGYWLDTNGLNIGNINDQDNIRKRPDDYFDNREDYDEYLYDWMNGSGAYQERIDSLQTDMDVDALEIELDRMWDKLESGSMHEYDDNNTAAQEQMKQTRMLTEGADYGMDKNIRQAEKTAEDMRAEVERDEMLERYAENAPAAEPYDLSMSADYMNRLDKDLGNLFRKPDPADEAFYNINNSYEQQVANSEQALFGQTVGPDGKPAKSVPTWDEYKDEWFISDEKMPQYGGRSEKDIFNGYYQAGRKEEAMAFMEGLRPSLRERKALAREYAAREAANLEVAGVNIGGLAGAAATLIKPVANVIEGADVIGSLLGVKGSGDMTSEWHTLGNLVRNTRDERGEIWDKAAVGWFGPEAAGWGKKFNGALYSILDNAVAMGGARALTAGVSPDHALKALTGTVQFIMSNGAAADDFAQRVNSGMDADEAAVYSVAQGVIEAITEKYSVEALFKENPTEMLNNIGRFLGKNFLTEGSEEVASDILSMFADDIFSAAYGHESEFRQRYKELQEDHNDQDAMRIALLETAQQFGESFAFGGLSGFVMSGARVIGNKMDAQATGKNIQGVDSILQNGGTEQLISSAQAMGEDTQSARLANMLQQKSEKGKNIRTGQLGRLAQNMQIESQAKAEETAAQTIEENAKQSMIDQGMDPTQAEELAPIVREGAEKGWDKLKRAQKNALQQSAEAMNTLKDMIQGGQLTEKTVSEIKENTAKYQSAAETAANLSEGKTAEGFSAESVGQQLASEDDIRQAEGEKTGANNEVIYDNQYARLEGMAQDEDGNWKYKVTSDGKTQLVDASDIKATNFSTAAVIRAQAENGRFYSGDYTGEMLKQIDQGNVRNVGRYMMDANRIRWAAYLGQEMPQTQIAEEQAKDLYRISMADAARENRENQAARPENYRGAGNGHVVLNGMEYGTKEFDQAIGDVDSQTRARIDYVADLARASGIELGLIDTGAEDYDASVHGWENNQGITLNLDSFDSRAAKEAGRKHHIVVTMSHEMTHWLQRNNPAGYMRLQSFVLDRMAQEGVNLAARADQLMTQRNIGMQEAIDEIVANACDQVLGNEQIANELKQKDGKLFNAIKGFVQDLVKKIRSAVVGMEDSASRDAQKLMYKYGNELAKIWTGVYDEVLQGKIREIENSGKEDITKMSQAELDEEYMDAVKAGDMEAAQKFVDEAAKRAGYTDRAYHGTEFFGFTKFDMDISQAEVFVAYDKDVAATYTPTTQIKKISERIGEPTNIYKLNDNDLIDYFIKVYNSKFVETISMKKVEDGAENGKSMDKFEFVYKDKIWDKTVTTHLYRFELMEWLKNAMNKNGEYLGIYNLYTKPGKQLLINARHRNWNDIPFNMNHTPDNVFEGVYEIDPDGRLKDNMDLLGLDYSDMNMSAKTRDIAEWARKWGYDSVRINNVRDNGGRNYDRGDEYSEGDIGIFFNQQDIKSADDVVYDDQGEIIKPSERFNIKETDIRYSVAELDAEYKNAVESGNWQKAEQMLLTKYEQQAGKGLIGYRAGYNYGGEHADIARLIKSGNKEIVKAVAEDMALRVPENAVLVPMPPHSGKVTESTDTMILARAISEITGRPVINALESDEHISRNQAKKQGIRGVDAKALGIRQIAEIPADAMPVYIDNVVGGGVTAKAAHDAVGRGITLAYAQSPRGKISGAKNLIVTYDSDGKLIPLSKRMDPNANSWKYSMAEMSLADLEQAYEDAYNAYDDDTGERIVAEMAERAFPDSKVRDKNGKLKVVYHQTNADPFTVFDMEKARQTEDVAGAFFAPEFDRYHEYGDRTYAVYLNITNPKYDVYDMDLSKENAGRMKRDELIAQGYDGVINTEDGKIIEYVAFYPEQIKNAEAFTEDDDGDLINLIQRFNKWEKDYRYSLADDQMEVNAWMMAQTPGKFDTENEAKLLQHYKGLRFDIDFSVKRQLDYKEQIRKLEQNPNPTWEEREQIATLRRRLDIQQDKQARLEDELYKVTSSTGYAGMMYRHSRLYADYVEGKTQAQVSATVDSLKNIAEKATKQIKKREAELEAMAENNGVRTIRQALKDRGLNRTVAALQKEYVTAMPAEELNGRLAEIILKTVNGEDTAEDFSELARDVVYRQTSREAEDAMDQLKQLRGRTIVIGPQQQAELKGRNSNLNEIRQRTKGSGVKFRYGESSTLESDWMEIQSEAVGVDISNSGDSLENIVRYIETLQNMLVSDKNEWGVDQGEVEAFLRASVDLMMNDQTGGLSGEKLAAKIRKREGALDKALAATKETVKTAEELLAGARKASGWTGMLRSDVQEAIDYFNATAKQAAQIERNKVRKNVIEVLQNEHTKELIKQQEEYEERIRKDKKARELHADNEHLRKQITTVAKRMKTLLTAETDQKNIQEEAKPLARMVTEMLVRHDMSGFRRVLFSDKATLEDAAARLAKMDQAYGKIELDKDLDWLVIHAENAEDNDYSLRDKVMQDLMDIEQGLLEYRTAEGQGNITLQDRKNALEKVQKAVSEIYSAIRARGEAFIDGQRMQVYQLAEDMRAEMENSRFKGDRRITKGFWNAVGYGNLTPEYFIKNLRNKTMSLLHKGLQSAENRGGLEAYKAKEKIEQIAKDTGYATWDGQEKHQVRVSGGQKIEKDSKGQPKLIGGNTVEMTTEQLMSLYATWLREKNQLRPENTAHLLGGGFVLAEAEKEQNPLKRVKKDAKPVRMTYDLLNELGNYLTEQQKEYVNQIVKYMSTDLAELGNEASLQVYGIKKFTEQYYFPIKTWGGVLNESSASGVNNQNDNRSLRPSFSKRVQAGASNAIEIGDFTPTAMKHVVGMINFNTIGPAVENLNKVLNQKLEYGSRTEEEDNTYKLNMRAAFKTAYGENAYNYLKQFMKDINGGTAQGAGKSPFDKLLTAFKKNAVAGSLSVAAQQPLSYIRAAMMINPKYLAQAISPVYWKGSFKEMMDHSGVAVIKQMGKFDMSYGRSMQDYITPDGKQTTGRKVLNQISDKSSILPQMMDNMTWTRMWSACKVEQKALHPEMDAKSEKFLNLVAERFNEVMRRTQVYDSIMVKSANMRNNHWYMKTITSFMAEPTLSLNVLADAWQNVKTKGGKANAAKALATFIVSAALQAGAKAIFSAGRSPDKKKTKEENLWNKFFYNLLGEANPLSLIPGYSQIVDTLANGELTDNSMSVIAKAKDATENLLSLISGAGDKTAYRKVEDSVGQLVQLFTSVPAKNIMRDFRAVVNLVSGGAAEAWTGNAFAQRDTSEAVKKYQLLDTIHSEDLIGIINGWLGDAGYGTKGDDYVKRIYAAQKNGQTDRAEELKEYYTLTKTNAEDPEKALNTKLKTLTKNDADLSYEKRIEELRNRGMKDSDIASWIVTEYKEGRLKKEEAEKLYVAADSKKKADDAYFKFEQVDWEAENDTDVSESKYFRLDDALARDDEKAVSEAKKELTEHGIKAKGVDDRIRDKILDRYKEGTASRDETIKQLKKYRKDLQENDVWWMLDRIDYKKATGKDAGGSSYYHWLKDAVNANKSDDIKKAVSNLLKHGITKEKIKNKLSDWKSEYLKADSSGRVRIKDAMQKAYKAAGYTAAEADETIKRWLKEKKKDGASSILKNARAIIGSTGYSDVNYSRSAMPARPDNDRDWGQYMDDLDEYWQKFDFSRNDPVGRYGKGTIDMNNRIVIKNEDGSISTERSFSFYDEDTGKEILIPLIVNGKVLTEQQAIDHYYETVRKGKPEYLGMFDNWKDADEYAVMLHNRGDWYYHR